MKKMLESKLKEVPEADREKLLAMVSKDPELFKAIAEEAQANMAQGMGQMDAVMAAVQARQEKLQALLK